MRAIVCVLSCLSTLAVGQVVINPTGGTGAADGIRISVGGTGQIQVIRNGTGQLFHPTTSVSSSTVNLMDNGVYLAIGNTVVGPANFATVASAGITLQEFTPISNTLTPQGQGGTATTVLRATVGGLNYDLTVTWAYTYPADFVVVTHSLNVPAGNTATVRLYHVFDAYLGGDDFGPSFFAGGPPMVVGGYREAANIVEAWRYRSGQSWTGYYAGFYRCLFDTASCPTGQNNSVNAGVTFTNYVNATRVDNSFGVMWNFGASPGRYTVQNDLTFYSFQPQLSKRLDTTVVTVPASTRLTFTIDNVPGNLAQSNMGFTDTFPAGMTVASSAVTNDCGGTVTTAGGAAIAAGATSLKLTGGALTAGTARCTITVNVTSAMAGAYVNGPSNISGISVVENAVTPQTLSVVQGAPIVRLGVLGTINGSNATAFPVTGTCQDSNGVVTVRVGTLTTTTPCSNNAFGTQLSVTALPDSMTVSVSASQTNPAGTGSDSSNTMKDTTAPGVPTFGSPAPGALISTSTPGLAGTSEPGSTVHVFAGPNEVCTAVANSSGSWTCVATPIADGTVTLTARAVDAAGNSGATSPGRSITIDTTPPGAPSITNPAAGSIVAPNPSVSGTAEPLATVAVNEGGTQLCTTTANAAGQWSCSTTLGSGAHTLVARQTDRAGNQGMNSAGRTFTIDNVPTVSLDTPGPINVANVSAVVVTGACTNGAGNVTVMVGTVMTTTSCSAGRFSTTVNATALVDGPSVVMTASQTNLTGVGTDTRTTIKDTSVPTTPAIVSPAEMAFINTTTPTFTGTGEPNSTIRVVRGSTELCTTRVQVTGQWACTSIALTAGVVVVTARATDSAENPSGVSPQRTFTIDTEAPAAPGISLPAQDASTPPTPQLAGTAEPFATVSVFEGAALVCSVTADATGGWRCDTTLGTGPHTVVARQTDRAGNVSVDSSARSFTVQGLPNVLLNTPQDISGGNAMTYVVTGACTINGGNVTVSVGLISTSVPCANGMFSATVDVRPLNDEAMVTVKASQTTAAGTGSDTRVVRKDASAPNATVITMPVNGTVTRINQPVISGTSEPGATVTIFLQPPQGASQAVGTAPVNASGQWSFTTPTPLADGRYTAQASARDAFGNEGARSQPVTFTIDSVGPSSLIDSPDNNTTHDADRPLEVTGQAEPQSTVIIFVDGKAVGEAPVDLNGRFTYPLDPVALGDGSHTVEVQARDTAGNVGAPSNRVTITVRSVEERFGGQGLVSCASAPSLWVAGVLLLWARRRRELRGQP